MLKTAGNLVVMDEEGQAKETLDFACYSCHQDAAGVSGDSSAKTLQELSDFVAGADGGGTIHAPTARTIVLR